MAQNSNNVLLVQGIKSAGNEQGLLPRILYGEIPDVYFTWGGGDSRAFGTFNYQLGGHTYSFSKESVSTAGQEPPYIRYKLQCSGTTRELTVYVLHPEEAGSVKAVRYATWAAFSRIINETATTYMYTIDAQQWRYVAEHAGEAQAQV